MGQTISLASLSTPSYTYEESTMYCDNCATDLPPVYIDGIIYNEPVRLCSGRCVAELMRVWGPTRHVWPWLQTLACLALVLIAWL